mgnify:CR=1 FL=1
MSEKEVRVAYSEGRIGRIVLARILPGTDMCEGITKILKEKNIQNGWVAMIGSLEKTSYYYLEKNAAYVADLRDKLIAGLERIPHSILSGDREQRLPGNVNFCFEGIEGEALLLLLDAKGICASSGSACTSGSLDPSHVLLAVGVPYEAAHGSLRLSLSEENTPEEVEYLTETIPEVVAYLRGMSPVWRDLEEGRKPHVI